MILRRYRKSLDPEAIKTPRCEMRCNKIQSATVCAAVFQSKSINKNVLFEVKVNILLGTHHKPDYMYLRYTLEEEKTHLRLFK